MVGSRREMFRSRRHAIERRWAGALAAIALALTTAGCAGFDRESYSLIFRKPAHQYEQLSEWQREELERYEATRVTGNDGFVASVAYQGFRPFRYCHRHKSYHVAESIGAVAVAPVEFPVTVGTYMGTIAVLGVGDIGKRFGRGVAWLWQEVFGAPDAPVPPPVEDERTRRSKQ